VNFGANAMRAGATPLDEASVLISPGAGGLFQLGPLLGVNSRRAIEDGMGDSSETSRRIQACWQTTCRMLR
jgi:hypothetical protein